MQRIYLDYNATTPVDPDVAAVVSSILSDIYGNPSSIHAEGRAARSVVEDARREVASLLRCSSEEIVFTGGGSESNNLAIKGVAEAHRDKGNHLVTSKVEHLSVLNAFTSLERKGWRVTYLDVDEKGRLDLDDLRAAVRDETVLVSLVTANNETGVIFPIREAVSIVKEKGAVFHTDAVQAVGKVDVDVDALDVDLLSIAAHKFYGPKGVGALFVRKGLTLEPLIHGGGQEMGRRSGTENVAAVAGFAKAAEMLKESLSAEAKRMEVLRRRLKRGIEETVDDVFFPVDEEGTLTNTLSVGFRGLSGESLVISLDLEGIAVSAGSACSSGALEPSHVLLAMGLDDEMVKGTIRISLGRWTTEEEIKRFLEILPPLVNRLRR